MHTRYVFLVVFAFACNLVFAQSSSNLPDTVLMPDVIVRSQFPIKKQNDTIIYIADSFFTNPEYSTEDLLKRLPGISVSNDGKIVINGKEATKLFLNGKEYNIGEIRNITQNLPAEMLDKIQFSDWYDEAQQFSGIKTSSDQTAINLNFKKKYQDAVFGKLNAGYGTRDRYKLSFAGNYMQPHKSLILLSGVNNVNARSTVKDDGKDDDVSVVPGLNTQKYLNLYFDIDRKDRLKFSMAYELEDRSSILKLISRRHTILLNDSILNNIKHSDQDHATIMHHVSMHCVNHFSNRFKLTADLNMTYENLNNNDNNLDSNGYNGGMADFVRTSIVRSNSSAMGSKINSLAVKTFNKSRRTLSVGMQLDFNNNKRSGKAVYNNLYFPSGEVTDNGSNSDNYNNIFNSRFTVQYSEPISKYSMISARYTNLYSFGVEKKIVRNGIAADTIDQTQSRDFENRGMQNQAGLLYQFQNKDILVTAGLDVQPYRRYSIVQTEISSNVYQNGVNYFPSILFKYTMAQSKVLTVDYIGSTVPPSLRQLQFVPDYTDSLNMLVGNPALKPQLINSFSANYSYFKIGTQQSLWFAFKATWTKNKIIDNTIFYLNNRITRYENANGNYSIALSLNYSKPMLKKKVKFNGFFVSSLTKNVMYVNAVLQRPTAYNLQPGGKILFLLNKWLDDELDYNCDIRIINFDNTFERRSRQVLTNGISAGLPLEFRLSSYASCVLNNGSTDGSKSFFLQLNMSIEKTLFKNRNLNIRLQAFDILNNYPTVSRMSGDNFFEDRTVNRIGRYFMLSLICKSIKSI